MTGIGRVVIEMCRSERRGRLVWNLQSDPVRTRQVGIPSYSRLPKFHPGASFYKPSHELYRYNLAGHLHDVSAHFFKFKHRNKRYVWYLISHSVNVQEFCNLILYLICCKLRSPWFSVSFSSVSKEEAEAEERYTTAKQPLNRLDALPLYSQQRRKAADQSGKRNVYFHVIKIRVPLLANFLKSPWTLNSTFTRLLSCIYICWLGKYRYCLLCGEKIVYSPLWRKKQCQSVFTDGKKD